MIKTRRMRWEGRVEWMEKKRNASRLLVGKPEGTKPLGRLRHWWENNIEMDLGEIGWGGAVWVGLAQDSDMWRALVNSVINLLVPWNAGEVWSGCTTGGLQ
jgi:hypothetical protein